MRLTAKTFLGLEEVLAEEIKELGGENIKTSRRLVLFEGDMELLYKVNYCVRTAINVLRPIHSFKATSPEDLYEKVKSFEWDAFLHTGKRFMIQASVRSEHFTHSRYAALKTKDAIADYFNEKFDKRPSVDRERPDIVIDLNIRNKMVTISLNSSGPPLFMRGYRKTTGLAPINELLAAGMIRISKWDRKSPFVDPMCGSGTIPIEAAMLAANVPAGYLRKFYSFQRWNDFDQATWDNVKETANDQITQLTASIKGSDSSMAMIKKARINASDLQEVIRIKFQPQSIQEMLPPLPGSLIMFNPPYGERLDYMQGIRDYKELGDIMKEKFRSSTCWIITSDRQDIKHIGLKTSERVNLMNGPLDCTFRKYELY